MRHMSVLLVADEMNGHVTGSSFDKAKKLELACKKIIKFQQNSAEASTSTLQREPVIQKVRRGVAIGNIQQTSGGVTLHISTPQKQGSCYNLPVVSQEDPSYQRLTAS